MASIEQDAHFGIGLEWIERDIFVLVPWICDRERVDFRRGIGMGKTNTASGSRSRVEGARVAADAYLVASKP